nr:EOG090X00WU [Moina brachiata]
MSLPFVFMVAEKPSLAGNLANILSNGKCSSRKGNNGTTSIHEWDGTFIGKKVKYKMTSVCGHVMSLDFNGKYNNWDSVDPVQLFTCPTEKKETNPKLRLGSLLAQEARGASYVVLWLDCDKEGENICFEVINEINDVIRRPMSGEKVIYRAKFSAITDKDIKMAMNTLISPNENESKSVDARQELDLRIGCAFTRFQTKFFQASVQVSESRTLSLSWERVKLFDREAVDVFFQKIQDCNSAKLKNVSQKSNVKKRPLPLNTVELLKAASSGLGISPHGTMQMAERLYTEGYISYPRTETTHYVENFDVRGVLNMFSRSEDFGSLVAGLYSSGASLKGRSGTDVGDHPPITPLKSASRDALEYDSWRIYDYVVRHFIASVSSDCKYQVVKLDFEIGTELFSASSKLVTDPGFTASMPWLGIPAEERLPDLRPGQSLPVSELTMISWLELVERGVCADKVSQMSGESRLSTTTEDVLEMASSDWLEVQRLAAEFQRAQLSTALQKLSERNCVEIVSKLIELKLVDLYYTNDGKEYVTPQQLSKEICDELYLHGGRIALMELVSILNINYQAIETRALEITQAKPEIHFVAGQLIDNEHLDHIAEEINEFLQQNGQISLVDLIKQYELPIEFLLQHLVARLGTVIQGHQDKSDQYVFFTEGFLARNKARIRGALSAITVPTSVSNIIAQNKFPEKLFFEYDALTRLGIPDPKGYCRKRFKETPLLYLSTCCVGSHILQQIEAAVEEALSSDFWIDTMVTVFDEEDAEQVIRDVIKNAQNATFKDAVVIGQSYVTNQNFINGMKPLFTSLIDQKAREVVESGAYMQAQAERKSAKTMAKSELQGNDKKDKKEERRKKANEGKVGGGVQGRETKTKATKKKYMKGRNDSDDEFENDAPVSSSSAGGEIEFMTTGEIKKVLVKQETLSDASDDFVEEIAARLHKSLQTSFQDAARSAYEAHLSASSGQRRQTHSELQEKIQHLMQSIKMGEKAVQQFASFDLQQQLYKYLLKTSGTELLNDLLLYVSQDTNSTGDSRELSAEVRQKLINELPQELKTPLQALLKASQGASIDEYTSSLETAIAACDIVLKKVDKKKEKNLGSQQRHSLIEQLNSANDPALVLHIAVLLLFHTITQNTLNASGRFVPQIIGFLQPHLPASTAELLTTLQGLVIQDITSKGDEELNATIRQKMEEIVPRVREAAVFFKKSNSGAE